MSAVTVNHHIDSYLDCISDVERTDASDESVKVIRHPGSHKSNGNVRPIKAIKFTIKIESDKHVDHGCSIVF